MESEHLQNSDVSWGHEPLAIPLNRPPGTFSPTGGEGWDEGVRFMERFVPLSKTTPNPLSLPFEDLFVGQQPCSQFAIIDFLRGALAVNGQARRRRGGLA